MIRHSVVFRLHHSPGSDRERAFMDALAALEAIEGVTEFQMWREVSPKNDFAYGLSMDFADQAAYDGYNNHPAHTAFVRDVWMADVAEFLEIDLVPMS